MCGIVFTTLVPSQPSESAGRTGGQLNAQPSRRERTMTRNRRRGEDQTARAALDAAEAELVSVAAERLKELLGSQRDSVERNVFWTRFVTREPIEAVREKFGGHLDPHRLARAESSVSRKIATVASQLADEMDLDARDIVARLVRRPDPFLGIEFHSPSPRATPVCHVRQYGSCKYCGSEFLRRRRGRPRTTCSDRCRTAKTRMKGKPLVSEIEGS